MLSENIISVSDLPALRSHLEEQTIVLATGCFDILHSGHLYFLSDASKQGDILVVGLNSDHSIKMIKGNHRPIVGQNERATLVAAIRYVDYVFIFTDTMADKYIYNLKPNVFAIGHESVKAYPSESIAAKQVGARVHIVTRIPSESTTSIVTSIRSYIETGPSQSTSGAFQER